MHTKLRVRKGKSRKYYSYTSTFKLHGRRQALSYIFYHVHTNIAENIELG